MIDDFYRKECNIVNVAYVYLQLYRLFDDITPIKADCGKLCSKICCDGDDGGMYLFPDEAEVYKFLKPDWIRIEDSEFLYEYKNVRQTVKIAFCNGRCDRYQRPLSCRIFPLTPYLTKDNKIDVMVDPRAKSICPLSKAMEIEDFDRTFVKNIKKAFNLLVKNKKVYAFMKEYTNYLNEYTKFFE